MEIVSQDEFSEAGSHFTASESHITHAWKMTINLASFMSVKDGGAPIDMRIKMGCPSEVNFNLLHDGIRYQETGVHPRLLLGRIAWNAITEINNSNVLSNDDRYIVNWIDSIHPHFRYSYARRMIAAEELAKIYSQLSWFNQLTN